LAEQPGVGVITKQGVLGLCQVQLEGKREMPVNDFVRGKRDFIGCILGQK
jgi:methionyl-tRNA formyltransferase